LRQPQDGILAFEQRNRELFHEQIHQARTCCRVSALGLSSGVAFADYTLDILHINDLHSRIESINRFDSTCSSEDETEGKCFGGIARVKTKIDERRDALTGDGRQCAGA
jgi:5'-nucleotidase/UDP-sugar diphosphatase